MKFKLLWAAAALSAITLASCQDDLSEIGSSLTTGEVTITVDSITTAVDAVSISNDSFDGRNMTKLLGRINVPEYGALDCSFLSQMLAAQRMNVPDSITVNDVDSMRLVLSVARGNLTGDSLAPQQLRVYRLNSPLPADISSTANPADYFDRTDLMGTKSYTLSNIAKGDSAMKSDAYVRIPVHVPLSFARELFTMYRDNSPVFDWPSSFNNYFKGIYVEPNFGNGCIGNVTKAEFYTYWHRNQQEYEMLEDSTYAYVDHVVRDSICLMASQPEVLSTNVVSYRVSDYIKQLVESGEVVITTPGGYNAKIDFPAQRLLDLYYRNGTTLSMVSSLRFEIPATVIRNDHDLTVAPYLLMIRSSEVDSFFAENKVPDGLTSFYAAYNSNTGSYQFNGMRSYFLNLLRDNLDGKQLTPEDTEFTLIPVNITTEEVSNYGSTAVYVTRCTPYILKPTMTRLYTDRCIICFVYSNQQID